MEGLWQTTTSRKVFVQCENFHSWFYVSSVLISDFVGSKSNYLHFLTNFERYFLLLTLQHIQMSLSSDKYSLLPLQYIQNVSTCSLFPYFFFTECTNFRRSFSFVHFVTCFEFCFVIHALFSSLQNQHCTWFYGFGEE